MAIEKPKSCKGGVCCSTCGGVGDFARKIGITLLLVFLVYLIFFLGTLIRNNLEKFFYIGRADKIERTITIHGDGKATVKPDVAMTTMGMIAEGATVAEAQQKNNTVMSNLTEKLKALGIEEKDIQTTNYNIYPQYNYSDKGARTLSGYEVSQSVTVKIRDLSKANQVIALAGEVGANNVSGLQFTVDNPDTYQAEARNQALEKISIKKKALASELKVKFLSIVSYNETAMGGSLPSPMYASSYSPMAASGAVESGTNEINLGVDVTFEVR